MSASNIPAKGRLPRWLLRILQGLLAVIIILPLTGTVYQAIATEIDQRSYLPPGQMIDVGGYRMHLYCTGQNVAGSPTVILEHGSGGISVGWALVQPEIASVTRVCSYDRAGMGWSDLGPDPRDAQHIATELHTLLGNADIPGPYVLVGWSFGGLYARMYAEQYPDEVAGMVLLDSSHPDQWTSTEAGKAQYESFAPIYTVSPWLARMGVMRVMGALQPDTGLPTDGALKASFAATKDWDAQSAEFLASPATGDQVRSAQSLGDLPLFVLTATQHGTPPEQEQLWQGWQIDLASLSTNSVHRVVSEANHASFWLDPEITSISIEAILHVLEAVSTGEQLKP